MGTMDSTKQIHPVDYKTHILIGQSLTGQMTVIAQWHYVPRLAEVQAKIDDSPGYYATFLLCTPTSIIPANGNSGRRQNHGQQSRYR
jgi:hypothetical protein